MWEIEKAIQALFLDEWRELAKLNLSEIRERIIEHLHESQLPDDREGHPLDASLYLQHEIEAIHQFAQQLNDHRRGEPSARELNLMPLPTLKECLRESTEFRDSVTNAAKRASET
ncbi:MAG: hypothetical protein WCS01_12840 [bacterium]